MEKKFASLLVVAICLFSACSSNVIINETHNFSDMKWMRFEPENFDVSVKNIDNCYDINIHVTVDPDILRIDVLPLIIDIDDSEGGHRMFMAEIPLRDKEGKLLGQKMGNFEEYTVKVREYFFFNTKGIHAFSIKNGTSYYELNGIASLGLEIVKSNMDIKIQ